MPRCPGPLSRLMRQGPLSAGPLTRAPSSYRPVRETADAVGITVRTIDGALSTADRREHRDVKRCEAAMPPRRTRPVVNGALAALIEEAGWTHAATAQHVNAVAAETGERIHYDRSAVGHWLRVYWPCTS